MKLVALLTSLYSGHAPLLPRSEDYREVAADCELFGIGSTLWHWLKGGGRLSETPSFFQDTLREKANRVLIHNMVVKHEMNQVLSQFDKRGIRAVIMKGVPFSEQYFSHTGARGTSDIDLLIDPSQMEEAERCLQEIGYQYRHLVDSSHFHIPYFKKREGNQEPQIIELHWNLLRSHTSSIDMEYLWKDTIPYGEYANARQMNLQSTFYMICLHGAKHSMQSMKYILDIYHLIRTRGRDIDYGKLFLQAKQDRTYKRILAALTVVYQCFPFLHDIKPLPMQKRWVYWSEGIIRLSESEKKHFRVYGLRTYFSFCLLDSLLDQWTQFKAFLFPPADSIRITLQLHDSPSYAMLYWKLYKHRWKRLIH